MGLAEGFVNEGMVAQRAPAFRKGRAGRAVAGKFVAVGAARTIALINALTDKGLGVP
jgi:hypothetical protein